MYTQASPRMYPNVPLDAGHTVTQLLVELSLNL